MCKDRCEFTLQWGDLILLMKKQSIKTYSKEQIQKLKSNIKLKEVVKKDFSLDKFGKNYFTACPFCGAKKALSISTQKQFGHCFSCNESFDVFGYYQKVKGLTFVQAVIEVKKYINLNNDIELQKLLKASIYFADLKQNKNPISGELLKSVIFKKENIIEAISKIDWIIVFLISDYSNLNQEKKLLPEEIVECIKSVQEILGGKFNEEPLETKNRLTNLFKYILELFELIKENNYNLSGIVYGLK